MNTQRRLLVPFLYIGVTNGDICCNEAQKARLGGAPGANPQLKLTLSSYHVNNLEKDLVRDANGKRLRVKAPVRIYLICNPSRRLVTHVIYTSLPRSPFVVKHDHSCSLKHRKTIVVAKSLKKIVLSCLTQISSYLMVRNQIHSHSLLVTDEGVGMVKVLAKIDDIDDNDDATKVLHDVDGYAMNETFIEWKTQHGNSSLNDSTLSTIVQTCFSLLPSPSHQSVTKSLKK
ncbi:hypothetical protein JHK86_017993 [Glycine max]|nr:hypothetical protein JHK86_017993 [Glycine max]